MTVSTQITSKKWIKYILLLVCGVYGFVFIFNLLIDPYGKQNLLCSKVYKPILNERAEKYDYIFYENHIEDYDSIVLGSSRVMRILPSSLNKIGKFYNFGISFANNAEKLFILKEWLKKKDLKTVYLGLDYFNFHKNMYPMLVKKEKFKKISYSDYFSFNTFKLSLKALKFQILDKPKTFFNNDGSINYMEKDRLIKENRYDFSKKRYETEAKNIVNTFMITNTFIIDDRVFGVLKEMKKLSLENGFKLKVFLTPAQKQVLYELSKHPKLLKKFYIIQQRLIKIFGNIYDFGVLNKTNKDRKNFYDPYHYRSNVGNKIIARLNSKGNYGLLLKAN